MVGAQSFQDTVPPGDYNFHRAIVRSSNAYFITVGLRDRNRKNRSTRRKISSGRAHGFADAPGIARVLSRRKNGFAPKIGLTAIPRTFVSARVKWPITPMQMAVVYSAIANGGKVLWPRFVERIEPQDPASGEAPTIFPSGVVRDTLGVRPRSLKIVHDAMLAETEDVEGTGRAAALPGLRVCGKTGTAQVKNEHGQIDRTGIIGSRRSHRMKIRVTPSWSWFSRKAAVPAEAFVRRLRMTFTRRF